MKQLAPNHPAWARKALAGTAALALCAGLSACGHSNSADEAASSDTVEMPAEEALSGIAATPAADPSATAIPDGAPVANMPTNAGAIPAAAVKAASGKTDKD